MKKYRQVAVIFLLWTVCGLYPNKALASGKPEPKWQKTPSVRSTSDPRWYTAYQIKDCEIDVYEDGNGIKIESWDPICPMRTLGRLNHLQIITIDQYGQKSVEDHYYPEDSDAWFILSGDTYVFGDNYARYAKNLPPEVRKLFRGHYGIK